MKKGKNNLEKVTSFNISYEDYDKLVEFAKESDLTVSQIIRRAIRFYIEFESAK